MCSTHVVLSAVARCCCFTFFTTNELRCTLLSAYNLSDSRDATASKSFFTLFNLPYQILFTLLNSTLLDFTWLDLTLLEYTRYDSLHLLSFSEAARNFSVSGNLYSVLIFIFLLCCTLLYFTILFFTPHTSLSLRETLSSHAIGLFCRTSFLLYGFFAKETYHLKDTQFIVLTWDSQQPREISQSRKTRIQPWRPVWHDFF